LAASDGDTALKHGKKGSNASGTLNTRTIEKKRGEGWVIIKLKKGGHFDLENSIKMGEGMEKKKGVVVLGGQAGKGRGHIQIPT